MSKKVKVYPNSPKHAPIGDLGLSLRESDLSGEIIRSAPLHSRKPNNRPDLREPANYLTPKPTFPKHMENALGMWRYRRGIRPVSK